MPTPSLMTWIPAQRRWTIRYMGRRHYVSCRQLGIKPETKEASIQAANAWWREKQASIDLAYRASQRQPSPHEQVSAAMLGSDSGDLLATLQDLVGEHFADPPPVREEMVAKLSQLLAGHLFDRLLSTGRVPDALREKLPPARAAQLERGIQEMHGEQTATSNRTVSALIQEWLNGQRLQADIGNISANRYQGVLHTIAHFGAFVGETSEVSVIDAERMEGFHYFCLSRIADKQWSRAYARSVFGTAKYFVSWLAGRGTIPPPANLSRHFRFGPLSKGLAVWPAEDCRRMIAESNKSMRLFLLLMLNCGMTQKDVSDLQDNEVDWREGRITRKRSKTRTHDNVPVVCYKLWPSTFALLRELRSGKERVLLTRTGKPFVNRRLEGGKVIDSDSVGSALRKIAGRLGIKRPVKGLRKTAATLLESHEVYGRYASYFLGHAPQSIADRHYVVPSQELFDAAVMWLSEQLGIDRP